MKSQLDPLFHRIVLVLFLCAVCVNAPLSAREYCVGKLGSDTSPGDKAHPFHAISKAAAVAQPGDRITVYEGVYRERVNPPRGGGRSDETRIVYQAAPGETVVIKGSEQVRGWKALGGDTWTVSLPNRYFGEFNPYSTLVEGAWFRSLGRECHLGAARKTRYPDPGPFAKQKAGAQLIKVWPREPSTEK